ncbi:MAG: DNA repair protein RecN [Myxococcota bacterium]
MIRSLRIQNFAIIEHQQIQFSGGYSAITGETGAGKSILLKALDLVLGSRANTDVIRSGEREARIEAEFELTDPQRIALHPKLEAYGLVDGDRLAVRRIISQSGRNRIYINDFAVRLAVLQDLTAGLADVIGQHASHDLLDREHHVGMLDTFAGVASDARSVSSQVSRLRGLQREVSRLQASAAARDMRARQIRRQLVDIDAAGLSPGEDERVQAALDRLQNAEQLQETTRQAFYLLREGNDSALDVMAQVLNQLQRICHLDEGLEKMVEVLASAQIEVQEVARDLGRFSDGVYLSPEELQELEERRNLIEDLKRLHGGEDRTIEVVLQSVSVLREELDSLDWDDTRAIEAAAEAASLEADVMQAARALSVVRQEAGTRLAALVEQELGQLGMPNCRFRVQINTATSAEGLTIHGLDAVEFLLSPNPGEGFKPLARTASGGELSRTMLALKGALIQTDPVGTYIFDEIDTGIGGGVAETVGRKLQTVGEARQVICITHLPQVASCAHQHLKVAKRVIGADRTVSEVRSLSRKQRIDEISRMLGGAEITEKTLEHATEMLDRAHATGAHQPMMGDLPLVWNSPTALS